MPFLHCHAGLTQRTFSQDITSVFVFQKELPGPKPAVDGGILLTVNVQVVFTLPEMPPLLHLSDGFAFSILNEDGTVDEVEGPADLENDLPTCEKSTTGIWLDSQSKTHWSCSACES